MQSVFPRASTRAFVLAAALAVFSLVAAANAAAVTPQISTNYRVSCVLIDTGSVKCTGENGEGQLGNGTTSAPRGAYDFVPGLTGVSQLAAGENHACALVGSEVLCWGQNNSFQLGQGGVDTTDSSVPVRVQANGGGNLTGVAQVASQDYFSCVIKTDTTAACWGAGTSGQLGDGGSTNLSLATTVWNGTGPLTGIARIAPGSSHTCAVLTDGTGRCWGSDSQGALGNGAGGSSNLPVVVEGLTNAVDIGAGNSLSCALISDGTVKCWGEDSDGQQGNGPGEADQQTPQTVPGVTGVTKLAVGYSTVCVLQAGGTVMCWGYGEDGENGNGGIVDVESPVSVTGVSGAIFISQQFDETPCVGFPGGAIKCWGYNDKGQIGLPFPPDKFPVATDIPNVDLVTANAAQSITTSFAKVKTDRKKKNYILKGTLVVAPAPFVALPAACAGPVTISTSYKYKKKRGKKKVTKTKKLKTSPLLSVNGANCQASYSFKKLPVKYLNKKKLKLTATFTPGNSELAAFTNSVTKKLPKVKLKKKK